MQPTQKWSSLGHFVGCSVLARGGGKASPWMDLNRLLGNFLSGILHGHQENFCTTAACSCEKPSTTLTCQFQSACNTMTLRGAKCILHIKKTEQNNSRLLKKASFISKYNTKLYLRNTQSCNVKTWRCAFQFRFKINSGVQMVHTSSTNSTEMRAVSTGCSTFSHCSYAGLRFVICFYTKIALL